MGNLYTYSENEFIPIERVKKDAVMEKLLATEFGEDICVSSQETKDLIKKCRFWMGNAV